MIQRLRQVALVILASMISFSVLAQQKTITGRVLDAGSKPLPGVTVSVKGKTTATSTNENGDYSINAAQGDVLVFSSVGFGEFEERVRTSNTLNVTMSASMTDLNEVVVVGYGTQKKSSVVASISGRPGHRRNGRHDGNHYHATEAANGSEQILHHSSSPALVGELRPLVGELRPFVG